jgi:response regulator RpfG family c-di-GMP phosphodiesterase
MPGRQVLSQLRAMDEQTQVVVITGQLLKDSEIAGIKSLGISEYLQKPISLEKLENILARILGHPQKIPITIKKFSKKIISSDVQMNSAQRIAVHELKNLLGIIRSQCESFTLDMTDGIYKGKPDKEVIKLAVEIMNTVIKTVDRANDTVEHMPKKKKSKSKKSQ